MDKQKAWHPQGNTNDCSTIERRIAVRYSCDVEATCQPGSVLPTDNGWPAKAQDISASGIGLILNRCFQPGTFLKIELRGPSAIPMHFLVSVAHSTPRQDGEWLVGCAFLREMSEDELRALLEGSAA
jgi:hypothetical protein